MNIKMQRFSGKFLMISALFLAACSSDEDGQGAAYEKGIFIVNEGAFGQGNGSISHENPETGTITADVVAAANQGMLTGDVVQDLAFSENKAYVVVNNANKILIFEKGSFVYQNTIGGRNMPRYLIINGNTAYLTQWVSFTGNGNLVKFDLNTGSASDSIELGSLPEQMLLSGNLLWVLNSNEVGTQGLSIVNPENLNVTGTADVGELPNSLQADHQGNVWVLAGGQPTWTGTFTPGRLSKVSPSGIVESTFGLPDSLGNPSRLTALGSNHFAFVGDQGVYSFSTSDPAGSLSLLIPGTAYGLAFHTTRQEIFVADPGTFSAAGQIRVYDPNGNLLRSYNAGIGSSSFVFVE